MLASSMTLFEVTTAIFSDFSIIGKQPNNFYFQALLYVFNESFFFIWFFDIFSYNLSLRFF